MYLSTYTYLSIIIIYVSFIILPTKGAKHIAPRSNMDHSRDEIASYCSIIELGKLYRVRYLRCVHREEYALDSV